MLHRTILFVVGMIGTLLLFVVITLIVAHMQSDCGIVAVLEHMGIGRSGCADDIVRVGFPLLFWEEGGMAYRSSFSVSTLLANSALALGVSVLAGWLCQRHFSRRADRST